MYKRNETRPIKVGNLALGGNSHIYIQSMCNTKTKDVKATIKQILELEKAGCEIIRVAVLDQEDAEAIKDIKAGINIPLVADIHFDGDLAITSIKNGVDAIRLNPGNLSDKEKITEVVNLCKEYHIPIRIGVNTGSLPKGYEPTAVNMVKAAKLHVDILESLDFHDIVISLKASNIMLNTAVYKLAAETFRYPLHLGVTEAGTLFAGLIKSSMGMYPLLAEGIGNTIRISLTDDPVQEVYAAKKILKNLDLIENVAEFTSCPTCGRTDYDMIPIANEIEAYLETVKKNIHVAVMGCIVNGPGESRNADLGIAGSKDSAILFKKGKVICKIPQDKIVEVLKHEIDIF